MTDNKTVTIEDRMDKEITPLIAQVRAAECERLAARCAELADDNQRLSDAAENAADATARADALRAILDGLTVAFSAWEQTDASGDVLADEDLQGAWQTARAALAKLDGGAP